MKKIAFICAAGHNTFIDPIVERFQLEGQYEVRNYHVTLQQDIINAVKWADIIWLEWANETSIFATSIYDLKNKVVICRVHSYEVLHKLALQLDWSVVDHAIFVAEHIRDAMVEYMPDFNKRVNSSIIPNGVELDKIPLLPPGDPHQIAMVCNLDHKKNPQLALQIMYELVYGHKDNDYVNKDWHLHIAGGFNEERYRRYLLHMVKEMELHNNVHFYGFVKDMESFWEGKGILLSTSIHEGHPLNIIEAMAHGIRPVIHHYEGAGSQFYMDSLYSNVFGAVDIIKQKQEVNENVYFRGLVSALHYTRSEQMKQFNSLITKLLKKGGKR